MKRKEKYVGAPADFAPSCLMGCGAAILVAVIVTAFVMVLGWAVHLLSGM